MIRLATFSALFIACTGGATATGVDTSTLTCPPDSTLRYEDFGQILIADNCISCHNGKESPRLGTVEEVRAASSRIMEAAVATTAMPDGTDMDLAERELLGEWLACGAP
ncbi:MAG: hypothetical protein ABI867_15535 [Kofleriaceae bacterium]